MIRQDQGGSKIFGDDRILEPGFSRLYASWSGCYIRSAAGICSS